MGLLRYGKLLLERDDDRSTFVIFTSASKRIYKIAISISKDQPSVPTVQRPQAVGTVGNWKQHLRLIGKEPSRTNPLDHELHRPLLAFSGPNSSIDE